ncbi:MAG: hypothetical protein PHT59_03370 [Candidatus Omnitrophica bacterium]|nr:hypothetical protein [Candidatus Omnitrophota bacterium]
MVLKKNAAGISMLEIVIAMVILALVLVGLVNVFVVSRSYVAHSRSKVSAGELGKVFLDPLQNEVRQDTWDNTTLNDNMLLDRGAGNPVNGSDLNSTLFGPRMIDGVTYSARYVITNTTSGGMRKVRVNITWDELQ